MAMGTFNADPLGSGRVEFALHVIRQPTGSGRVELI